MKKVLKYVIVFISVLFVAFEIIMLPSFNLVSDPENRKNYSRWMSENLPDNIRVVDIAMLGSHDALASRINLFSKIDIAGLKSGKVPMVFNSSVAVLIKGFIVRQSNTQMSKPLELLQGGVRYLDIRASFRKDNGAWFSTHNYYIADLEKDLNQIAKFLKENPGEVVILDFQHVFHPDTENGIVGDPYWTEIVGLLEKTGVMNYSYNFNKGKTLSRLTYAEATDNRKRSCAVIVGKQNLNDGRILNYEKSIRSSWFNSDSTPYIIERIIEEADIIKNSNSEMEKLRIMQAVKTAQVSGEGVVNAIMRWSLIDEADRFNAELILSNDFINLLDYLPIVMVDYSDSQKGKFHDKMMSMVINFNKR